MSDLPACPQCGSEYSYEDRSMYVCPECGHEWSGDPGGEAESETLFRDANGTALSDGDTVTVTRDLKIKGSSAVVKVGTKVKNIRLVSGDHDVDCKIPGFGALQLKSKYVKKV